VTRADISWRGFVLLTSIKDENKKRFRNVYLK
jgi:hypothetical protein